MQELLTEKNHYWFIKKSNEYEYTDMYYFYGQFEDIKTTLRNHIETEFPNVQVLATITDKKIKFEVENVLDYNNEEFGSIYQFETYSIEAILRPNIKDPRYLKYAAYNVRTGKSLNNGA